MAQSRKDRSIKCAKCPRRETFVGRTLTAVVANAKIAGWRYIRSEDPDVFHLHCPACAAADGRPCALETPPVRPGINGTGSALGGPDDHRLREDIDDPGFGFAGGE